VNKKSPCLREYIASMLPSLLMSGVMGVTILFFGIFLQNMFYLPLLIILFLFGMAICLGLVMYSQKELVIEIRDMIWGEKPL